MISEINPVPESRVLRTRGETTVYGKLIRFGGMRPRAFLLLSDGSRVFAEITHDMAKELEARKSLYNQVGIEGEATWRVDTWEIVHFKATRIAEYQPHKTEYQPHKMDIVQTFEALAEAAKDRWDNVDVVQFVNNLRDRDEE